MRIVSKGGVAATLSSKEDAALDSPYGIAVRLSSACAKRIRQAALAVSLPVDALFAEAASQHHAKGLIHKIE